MRTLVLLFLLSAPALAQSNANGAAAPAPVSTPDAMPAPAPETPAPAPETPSDAPKAEPAPAPGVTPAPVPAPTTAPSENTISLTNHSMPQWWIQAAAGGVAGLISVPIAAYVGGWLGNLTNNVYLGLVPWALVMAFLPSLAVTAAVVGIGNYYSPGTFPFWRVWGLTSIANIAALAIVVAGQLVSVGSFATVVLYAICDTIVMTAVATPTARWLATPKTGQAAGQLASLEPWNAGAPQRWFVSTAEVKF